MAKQVQIQRLTTEDFAGQAWAAKLIVPLNTFMESVQSALTNGLTVSDNLSGALKIVEIAGSYPIKLAWTLKTRPVSLLIGNVVRSDGTEFTLTAGVFVQWSFTQDGQLQIDNVVGGWPVGEDPSTTYKYKLLLEVKTG